VQLGTCSLDTKIHNSKTKELAFRVDYVSVDNYLAELPPLIAETRMNYFNKNHHPGHGATTLFLNKTVGNIFIEGGATGMLKDVLDQVGHWASTRSMAECSWHEHWCPSWDHAYRYARHGSRNSPHIRIHSQVHRDICRHCCQHPDTHHYQEVWINIAITL